MSCKKRKPSHAENIANKMRQNGSGAKFDHPGVYCITVDGGVVYVGKSRNMLDRLGQHMAAITNKREKELKYQLLREAKAAGHKVRYDVLYNAEGCSDELLDDVIGQKEAEYIQLHQPRLNT